MKKSDYSFFEDVYDVVEQIPRGQVSSYGAIARYLGSGKSARMVGWALTQSHQLRPNLPAHRVVNRNGLLSGRHHFGTPTAMQERLEQEGLTIEEHQIKDFRQTFWDPSEMLGI